MGTNYYLVRDTDMCASCGENPTAIHIGKSSAGWVFLWRGYRPDAAPFPVDDTRTLDSPTGWFAFLAERVGLGWRVEDEYGTVLDLARLRERVEAKRSGGHRAEAHDLLGTRLDRVVAGGDEVAFYHFR